VALSKAPARRAARHDDVLARAGVTVRLLLGFAPAIAFAALMRLSISLALWTAFALSFALGLPSFLDSAKLKTLDTGSFLMFGALALLAGWIAPALTLASVRLIVDAGLCAIVAVSLWRRDPFSLQYARDGLAIEDAASPWLRAMHYRISLAWLAAFAVMTVCDGGAVLANMPEGAAVGLALAAAAAALIFTLRYPFRVRERRERSGATMESR